MRVRSSMAVNWLSRLWVPGMRSRNFTSSWARVAWLRLLIADPRAAGDRCVRLAGSRLHPVLAQNTVHGRSRYRHAMKALQIVTNPTGTKVIGLPQVQHLADDVARRGTWASDAGFGADRIARPRSGRRSAVSICSRSSGRSRNAGTSGRRFGAVPVACCKTLNRQATSRPPLCVCHRRLHSSRHGQRREPAFVTLVLRFHMDGMALPAATHPRDLTDEQSDLIERFLPEAVRREAGRGRPWRENRAVLNGILWILRTGAPWAELPDRYPSNQTCHRRFPQWVRAGVPRSIPKLPARNY